MALDVVALGAAKKYTDEQLEKSTTGGVSLDHSKLKNRDSKSQHPIAAIEGLEQELEKLQKAKYIFIENNDEEFWGDDKPISVQNAINYFRFLYSLLAQAEYITYTPTDPDVDFGGDTVSVQAALDLIVLALKDMDDFALKEEIPTIKEIIDALPKYNGEVAEV